MSQTSGQENTSFFRTPHKNVEHAYKIIEALQSAGYRVWFDEGLELGTGYNQAIAERIEECEAFMCLLTTEYYQSDYCRMEFNFALEECKKRIIPVFMGNASQIKKSFPAGMRMYLAGVNAFLLAENVDINAFMHKIAGASILGGCREEKPAPTQKRPVAMDRFDSLRKANVRGIV